MSRIVIGRIINGIIGFAAACAGAGIVASLLENMPLREAFSSPNTLIVGVAGLIAACAVSRPARHAARPAHSGARL